ncbi:MAG: NYN domain-containing protein [Calditrichaeota bacterium]|nr:NYN domain-containing protein [Calditrichota bacterium]MCB0267153.1 NYN domain-containing protein [Calditrichota bacterium]
MESTSAVGIYIDAANLQINGGYGMKFDILREFACHDNGKAVRLNIYVTYDEERARKDNSYRVKTQNYFRTLRDFGYKVIIKKFKWYRDEEGQRYAKANADLDMAVDALLQSENLERILMCTGDGDFVQVIRALQNKGCRLEVLAFSNVSADLRAEADEYFSGYLVPNLLPVKSKNTILWGDVNSRVRGTCYHFNQEEHYGFLRFMKFMKENLWITDTRRSDSPYDSAFIHESDIGRQINTDLLPNHDTVFEFDIVKTKDGLQAKNVEIIV